MVTVGDTTAIEPVEFPGFHVYDEAPVAVNDEDDPTQMDDDDVVAVNVGNEFTVRLIVFVLEHPEAIIPVTV